MCIYLIYTHIYNKNIMSISTGEAVKILKGCIKRRMLLLSSILTRVYLRSKELWRM